MTTAMTFQTRATQSHLLRANTKDSKNLPGHIPLKINPDTEYKLNRGFESRGSIKTLRMRKRSGIRWNKLRKEKSYKEKSKR